MNIAEAFGRYLRRPAAQGRWNGPVHTPLERLPMVAIDCETTGLDPRRDRIVSFAAIRIEGLRVAAQPALALLIDPGIAIPPRATAVHGIDRAQLAGAPSFADSFAAIEASLEGAVAIGHHVGFDLAVLAREAKRAGRRWHEPPSFDTAHMAAAIGYAPEYVDLGDLLGRLGIERRGQRHSAAGD